MPDFSMKSRNDQFQMAGRKTYQKKGNIVFFTDTEKGHYIVQDDSVQYRSPYYIGNDYDKALIAFEHACQKQRTQYHLAIINREGARL